MPVPESKLHSKQEEGLAANHKHFRFDRHGRCGRSTRRGPNLRCTALRPIAEDRIVLGPTSADARKFASLACLFLRHFDSGASPAEFMNVVRVPQFS
jgi:hypothetical protein